MKLLILIILAFLTHSSSGHQESCVNDCHVAVGEIAKDKILLEKKIEHEFSDPMKYDEFCICLKGESLIHSVATFTIIDPDGVEIFKEEFSSILLIGYGLSNGFAASKRDQESYIIKRVKEFFNNENFLSPAIDPNQQYNPDYSDKSIWDDIKKDKTAIGFYYLIGEEDGRSIAYSKTMKKVVMYYNCC